MNPLILFADGASSGNPGPGGWGTILVYQTQVQGGEAREVRELGGAHSKTTNNRMELTALTEGLGVVISDSLAGEPIRIYTDSKYVIQGITRWIRGWKSGGWKTATGGEVLNRDLWEKLDACVGALRAADRHFEWNYVPGHSGIPGNERTDEIAVRFSKKRDGELDLYQGPLSGYPVRVLEMLAKPKSAGPAYYLSLVAGVLQKHATWSECEARVKGQRGARFKKVSSPEEEQETLRSWGNFQAPRRH